MEVTQALRRLAEVYGSSGVAPLKPSHVTPGDPVVIDGVGTGRVVNTVAGSAWVHLGTPHGDPTQFQGSWYSGAVMISDLSWIDGAWRCSADKLGAAGDGPGAERFPGSIGRGVGEGRESIMVDALRGLRDLVEGRRSVAREDDDSEAPNKPSASAFIGDVLDALMGTKHLSDEALDDAAAVIATKAEEGPEAVVKELIAKGYIPGKRLTKGGHAKMRETVFRAMREWFDMGVFGVSLEEGRSAMSERQVRLSERLENAIRDAAVSVLRAEGFAPLDIDGVTSEAKRRIRNIADAFAMRSTRRGSRAIRD